MNSAGKSYRDAGVDIEAGYRAVELMEKHLARTATPGVLSGIGGFGGVFMPDISGLGEPVLVSGADGVGTKLRIAFLMDKHDTVGIDCVAMCVNDILCCGARPIFFLDYLALGKNLPDRVERIVAGVAEGCVQAGCALIGGETAEMPGFYHPGEYDLAGFAVGLADRQALIGPQRARAGDVLLALPSSGLHSNGFSLAREVFGVERGGLGRIVAELGQTLGEALLTPTRIYVKPVLAMMKRAETHCLSHITGGGFYENIPRMLPEGLRAVIDKSAIRTPPIFTLLAKTGNIPERDMFNTFNMGVGMCAAVAEKDADEAVLALRESNVYAYPIGALEEGERGVELK